jgi:hypothetical protein
MNKLAKQRLISVAIIVFVVFFGVISGAIIVKKKTG